MVTTGDPLWLKKAKKIMKQQDPAILVIRVSLKMGCTSGFPI
jgi:Fe-S cluster assembly iron-binding protein IscA